MYDGSFAISKAVDVCMVIFVLRTVVQMSSPVVSLTCTFRKVSTFDVDCRREQTVQECDATEA